MKILVVHNRYIHRGGEDVCVDREIEALRGAGIDVHTHFVDSRPGTRALAQGFLAPWGSGAVAQAVKVLRDVQPDVLHAHNLFPLLSPRLFSIARKLHIKTVLTLHNYRPLCHNGLFLTPAHEICERCAGQSYLPGIVRGCYRENRLQSFFMAGHLTMANRRGWYRSVDRFIAPSRFLKEKFISYGLDASRITVQSHFLPDRQAEAPQHPAPYILYLGRLSEEKGVRWLLQLFKETSINGQLKIAGDGPLKETVVKSQDKRIAYVGQLSGVEKQKTIAQAAAVMLPSNCYENFPLTVLEANNCGVPVVAPALGGFPELIESGVNGFTYEPRNMASAAQILARILSTPQVSLRTSSQRHAHERYSKESFLTARLSLYQELLAKRI